MAFNIAETEAAPGHLRTPWGEPVDLGYRVKARFQYQGRGVGEEKPSDGVAAKKIFLLVVFQRLDERQDDCYEYYEYQ